jgi:hypothetical protein
MPIPPLIVFFQEKQTRCPRLYLIIADSDRRDKAGKKKITYRERLPENFSPKRGKQVQNGTEYGNMYVPVYLTTGGRFDYEI